MSSRTTFYVLAGSLAGALSLAAAPQINQVPSLALADIIPFASMDYDGDGVDELIGPAKPGSGVAAYSIAADGTLLLEKRLANEEDHLRTVTLADLDGDGLLDLLGLREDEGGGLHLVVYYDRGGVMFEDPVPAVPLVPDLEGLTATDFDMDGDLDIVLYPASRVVSTVSGGGGTTVVAFNQGGGMFADPIEVQSFVEPLRSAEPIELDQDGDLDFVALRNGSGTLVLLRRQGALLQIEAVLSSPMDYHDLAVGDVNGDGREDVVAYRQAATGMPADIDLYLGNALGGLGGPVSILSGAMDLVPDVSLLDIDGDGDLDLAIAGSGTLMTEHRVRVLAGDGLGGFTSQPFSSPGSGQAKGRSLSGDFDGDGLGDLFSVGRAGAGMARDLGIVRSGQAGPGFAAAFEFGRYAFDLPIILGDVDGDGVPDLLGSSSGELIWLRGASDADGFEAPVVIAATEELVLVGNFDGDASEEILVRTPSGFGWIDSLGGGAFAPGAAVDIGSIVDGQSILSADVDGDGDLDLVVSPDAWLANQGALQFGALSLLNLQGGPLGSILQVGDFNGDGRVDLHVLIFGIPSFASFSQAWYEGLGGGQFGPQQLVGLASGFGLVVVDFDGDGFDDTLWPGPGQSQSGIYLAVGGPAGMLPTAGVLLVATPGFQQPLGAADFDGDGLKDLLTYDGAGRVFGYSRLAGGGLAFNGTATALSDALFNGPGSLLSDLDVQLVDVSGDHDLDLLISVTGAGIIWYENQGRGPVGTIYCGPGVPNGSGESGRMLALGTAEVAANELRLRAANLPRFSFGFFITSQTQVPATSVVGSSGLICLGGSVGRYVGAGQVQSSGANGSFSLEVDVTAIPTPLGFVSALPGASWSFQAWHRDSSPAGPTSNFTEGLEITFQ